ncbi:MAG: hypothetical protein ACYDEX_20500 [Mobilitalea sp.]
MGNIDKFIRSAFALMVFCGAVLLLSIEARTYTKMLGIVRESIKQDAVYQQYNILDREIITYSELVASLFQSLEYDIMIDGVIIRKSEHDTDSISGYGIRLVNYKKTYHYDGNGVIIMIVYTGES